MTTKKENEYTYPIFSMDPVHGEGENILLMLYVKPDIKLLNLFQRMHDKSILVRINGTNSSYDNKTVFAIVDKSSDIVNLRQNLFNCGPGNIYCLTLDMLWQGYTESPGTVTFIDEIVSYLKTEPNDMTLSQQKSIDQNPFQKYMSAEPDSPKSPSSPSSKPDKKTNWTKVILYLGIIIALFIIIYFAVKTHSIEKDM